MWSKRGGFAVALALVVQGGAACIGGAGPVDAAVPSELLGQLREREQDHAESCARWVTPEDEGDEPDRYVDDMDVLSGDMVDTCSAWMEQGRIGQADHDRVDGMRGRIRIAVEEHRAAMREATDGAAMHDACSAHHVEMGDLLDETEATLDDAGMMSGRMMGGGGMM